jgi:hypothetical protein
MACGPQRVFLGENFHTQAYEKNWNFFYIENSKKIAKK